MSGAKVAELPSRPSSKPCASPNTQMFGAKPARTNPANTAADPIQRTREIPYRSANLPVHTPPQSKTNHHQGVGQRGIGSTDAKFRLNRGQHYCYHVHATTA